MSEEKPKRKSYNRRLRDGEVLYIGRYPAVAYRCPKKKRWCLRVFGAKLRVARPKQER